MKTSKIVGSVCWYLGFTALAVALGIGNSMANDYHSIISLTLKQDESKIVKNDEDSTNSEYFKSSYASDEEREEKGRQLCEEAEKEGIVLLKNEENTLPLKNVKKISLFGMDSANPVYGGTGSGSIKTETAITAKAGFENAGYEVNPTLWDFYNGFVKDKKYLRTSAAIEGNAGVQYKVNEAPQSEYTSTVKNSYQDYKDCAIVFIGRSGGEGSDLSYSTDENQNGYLALSQNEADLLQSIQDGNVFDKIIIVINSSNSMELAWMENYSKIKGAIWVGSVGTTGMNAVAKTISGEYNPSGRLVDTYAADSKSAPAIQNFGNFEYTNASELSDLNEPYFTSTQYTGKNYIVYQEGIYIGYRYYETRYEDAVYSRGNAGNYRYQDEVTYPFGYGLSYTTFAYSDYSVSKKNNEYIVSVSVTNTGKVDGKTPIQVYAQNPYTDYDKENGIEKSSIELVGYTKTDTLKAGEKKTYEIKVDEESLRTYDSKGAKTYIQDGGDYYFAIGDNAHDALNNILAAKGKTVSDGMTSAGNANLTKKFTLSQDFKKFSKDSNTGKEITNQFDNADVNYYFSDVKYLTRSDWTGTFPTHLSLTATEKLKEDLRRTGKDQVEETDASKYEMPTFGATNDITLITMKDVSYSDENWNKVLDNMTKEEAIKLVTLGGYKTQPVESIAYPGTTDKDGPQGISSTLVGGTKKYGMAYTSEVVLASTFNDELVEKIGIAIGEDGLALGVTGWYGPAMNMHRTPFTGRSFEYFSEDPYLSGMIASAEIKGARSKGMITYSKHLALNDQDTNRKGLATFANEQTIREIYLKPFELAFKVGKTNAYMESHNRLGATWIGGSSSLLMNVLREEWGFDGFVLTDYVGTPVYQSALQAVINGDDMMLCTKATADDISQYKDNAYVMTKVREACHRILYTVVNTAAMNGITKNTRVVEVTPAWRYWLLSLTIVVSVGIVAGAVLVTYHFYFKKDKKEKEEK